MVQNRKDNERVSQCFSCLVKIITEWCKNGEIEKDDSRNQT